MRHSYRHILIYSAWYLVFLFVFLYGSSSDACDAGKNSRTSLVCSPSRMYFLFGDECWRYNEWSSKMAPKTNNRYIEVWLDFATKKAAYRSHHHTVTHGFWFRELSTHQLLYAIIYIYNPAKRDVIDRNWCLSQTTLMRISQSSATMHSHMCAIHSLTYRNRTKQHTWWWRMCCVYYIVYIYISIVWARAVEVGCTWQGILFAFSSFTGYFMYIYIYICWCATGSRAPYSRIYWCTYMFAMKHFDCAWIWLCIYKFC